MIYDVVIIGAGMAGVSLAAELDPQLSVLILAITPPAGRRLSGTNATEVWRCSR
jgi:flavin-dependent dehydrogenase